MTTMASLLSSQFADLNQWINSHCDPRTRHLPLMGRVEIPIGVICVYLLVVVRGPTLMRNRPAIGGLKVPMLVYNLICVVLSLQMTYDTIVVALRKNNFSFVCMPYRVSYRAEEMRLVRTLWLFYVVKNLELLDTVFMVLRKKSNQISFLHVHHHTTMMVSTYLMMVIGPGGQAHVPCFLNCLVHVIMYSYYALSTFESLRPYLWWKRYLTQLQLVQFLLMLASTMAGIYVRCDYPRILEAVHVAQVASFFLLFGNFYLRSYLKPAVAAPPKSKKHDDDDDATPVLKAMTNGTYASARLRRRAAEPSSEK